MLSHLEGNVITARLLGGKHGFQRRQLGLRSGELGFADLHRTGRLYFRRGVLGFSKLQIGRQRFDLEIIKRHRRIETRQLQPPLGFAVGQRVCDLKFVIEPHIDQPVAHSEAQRVRLADHDGLRHEAVGRIRARTATRVGHVQLWAGRVGAGVHVVRVLAIGRDVEAEGHRPIEAATSVRVAAGQLEIAWQFLAQRQPLSLARGRRL